MGLGKRVKDRFTVRRRASPGTSPGTLVPDPTARASRVSVLAYGPDGFEERQSVDPGELAGIVAKHAVTWVDVDGLGDMALIERVGSALELHPLALEDATNLYQRPKFEEYPSHAFVVVRMAQCKEHVHTEQLAIFLG